MSFINIIWFLYLHCAAVEIVYFTQNFVRYLRRVSLWTFSCDEIKQRGDFSETIKYYSNVECWKQFGIFFNFLLMFQCHNVKKIHGLYVQWSQIPFYTFSEYLVFVICFVFFLFISLFIFILKYFHSSWLKYIFRKSIII